MPPATARDAYTGGAAAPPLWARPDPALAAAGIEGEFVVARVRLVAMALLMIAPTWNITHYPDVPIHRTGFSYTMNEMRADPEDKRSRYLLQQLFQVLGR